METISKKTEKMLALSMLKGVGPVTLHQIAALPNSLIEDIDWIAKKSSKILKSLELPNAWITAQNQACFQISEAERSNTRIISILDDDYPELLRSTKDAPYIIYVKGTLHTSPKKSVAIIGTRQPTKHGIMIADRVTTFFAQNGWSIVSGLALGCDSIAHRSALAMGAHTVAVLAHGLDTVSPSSHKQLTLDILNAGGALVSEYGFGSSAIPSNFVKRDRTQAGLAQGVVMIQSDLKGGSLHASRAALQYGRWLAVPYPTDQDREAAEAKIQANLLFASNSTYEKKNLLKCETKDLDRLHIFFGKEDYPKMLDYGSHAITPYKNDKIL
jgi:DNA processing protein